MFTFKKLKRGYASLEILIILSLALSLSAMAIASTERIYNIDKLEEQEIINEMSEVR